jgi:hypothetical protein
VSTGDDAPRLRPDDPLARSVAEAIGSDGAASLERLLREHPTLATPAPTSRPAVAFGQWNAARRLLERGARTNLWQAASARPPRCSSSAAPTRRGSGTTT